jgi:hypothetical protein
VVLNQLNILFADRAAVLFPLAIAFPAASPAFTPAGAHTAATTGRTANKGKSTTMISLKSSPVALISVWMKILFTQN